MTPERWRRIEELCHAALALPADRRDAFLAQACTGDDALLREVESLIAQDGKAGRFLSRPAAVAGTTLLENSQGAPIGGRIGGYAIRSLLGVGGMGEVYRAYDETLGREVAIKVLPPQFIADPQRQARFEREARMLATLNHPHIGAIYGVEEAGGLPALVLELVEGSTLAERISAAETGAGLPLGEVISIGCQITEALEAAHEKGIVHRDLKPANIKITPDGVVKVLDFGLAKVASLDHPGSDPTVSRDGAILGTAAYMSPEQARSHHVDKRSDIWAFGCVLYEMLTGRVAFPGETVSDTIAGILERPPDWSALPAATPRPMRRLLFRCLTKPVKQRLRDIGDARIELDAMDDGVPGAAGEPSLLPVRASAPGRVLPWVALAALAAGVLVGKWVGPAADVDPFAGATISRFTNWDGTEEAAEISPDGKFVAFLSDRSGEFDIWLSQVGSRQFIPKRLAPLAPGGAIVRKLGFSADGTEIWFNPGDGKSLLRMPMTAGTPQPFLGEGANTPAWSADGKHVAFVFKPNRDDPMFVADVNGGDRRQVLAPGTSKNNNPVWSPDGEWIYFARGPEPQDETDMDIWRVRSSGGEAERVTEQRASVNFLTLLDSRTLLYVARAADWSGPWLWMVDVERRVPRRLSLGVDQYTSVSASGDGRRIVATIAHPTGSLWRVPLLSQPATDADASPYVLPMPMGRTLGPRFGGASLYYLSSSGTGDGLWKAEEDKASEIWRNADAALSEPPAVSPDGKRLAVVVRENGKRHLSIMSADGTNRQTLAPDIEIDGVAGQGTADWSPDGTQIVAGGHNAQGPALFVIPVDGGTPVPLLPGKWVNPVWSPDGQVILYAGRSLVGQVQLLAVRPDGVAVELPAVWVRPGGYRFVPKSRRIVYLPRIHSLDFWMLDLATGQTRPLTRFGNHGTLRTFDITPDGQSIVFDRSRQNSDIVLIDRAKSPPD